MVFKKGEVSWNKGKKLGEEHKRKIGEANKISLIGNIAWNRGMKGYSTIKNGETIICEKCKKETKKTAQVQRFCPSCRKEHMNEYYQFYLQEPSHLKKHKVRVNRLIEIKDCCEICSSTDRLEKHHWNYDKPLLVNTLCGFCHDVQHYKNINNVPLLEVIRK